ncbi:MAG: holo-ACP synthase [Oscillospiraceae bacterium]|nr:holo-ACP synthase [Oscillospiraceae bacterium]
MRGIGIDMLDIGRMERPMRSPRFVERVFTEGERRYLESRTKNKGSRAYIECAAGLFCAKEAVTKALGVGLLSVPLHSVEIVHEPGGRPAVLLHAPLSGRVHLTITHTASVAAAAAVWE